MSHLLPGFPATPDVGLAPPAVRSPRNTDTTSAFVTEQDVALSTAAVLSVPPAAIRRGRLTARVTAATRRIFTRCSSHDRTTRVVSPPISRLRECVAR